MTPTGTQANGPSGGPLSPVAVSAAGDLVAFASEATNLTPPYAAVLGAASGITLPLGDTNGVADVFLHDLRTRLTERVSVGALFAEANGASRAPSMSADGRFVAFESDASNLAPGDTNGKTDVYLRDRLLGTTERVSVPTAGSLGNGASRRPSVSADGRFVAFESEATNLSEEDLNGAPDVYVHDRGARATFRASVGTDGDPDAGSFAPSIAPDAGAVVFHSAASDLVAGDINGLSDVFAYLVGSGVTRRVSLGLGGVEPDGPSRNASVGGGQVAFESDATNLEPLRPDTNGVTDVFVAALSFGLVRRIGSHLGEPDGWSAAPAVSPDGTWVAFVSAATNLVPNDANSQVDVFAFEVMMGAILRASEDSAGGAANGPSHRPAASAAGFAVAFSSDATNLVPGDTNETTDVFAKLDCPGTVPGILPGVVVDELDCLLRMLDP